MAIYAGQPILVCNTPFSDLNTLILFYEALIFLYGGSTNADQGHFVSVIFGEINRYSIQSVVGIVKHFTIKKALVMAQN